MRPTFYRDFPVEVSPQVRQHQSDPRVAERWDLVVSGADLGTGYSGLVDPAVQRARWTAQSLLKVGGDPKACGSTRTSCAPWSTACPDRRHGHRHRPPADDARRPEHP